MAPKITGSIQSTGSISLYASGGTGFRVGSPMNGTKSSADFGRYAGTSSITKDARKSTGIGSDACSGIFPALAAGFRSGIEWDLTLRLGHLYLDVLYGMVYAP